MTHCSSAFNWGLAEKAQNALVSDLPLGELVSLLLNLSKKA